MRYDDAIIAMTNLPNECLNPAPKSMRTGNIINNSDVVTVVCLIKALVAWIYNDLF